MRVAVETYQAARRPTAARSPPRIACAWRSNGDRRSAGRRTHEDRSSGRTRARRPVRCLRAATSGPRSRSRPAPPARPPVPLLPPTFPDRRRRRRPAAPGAPGAPEPDRMNRRDPGPVQPHGLQRLHRRPGRGTWTPRSRSLPDRRPIVARRVTENAVFDAGMVEIRHAQPKRPAASTGRPHRFAYGAEQVWRLAPAANRDRQNVTIGPGNAASPTSASRGSSRSGSRTSTPGTRALTDTLQPPAGSRSGTWSIGAPAGIGGSRRTLASYASRRRRTCA